jgi:hypothetical protein
MISLTNERRRQKQRYLLTGRLFLGMFVLALFTGNVFAKVSIQRTNYHGWPEAYVMNNGQVNAVIVPAIGRVMQFGFVGEEGVFWENRALDGREVDGQLVVWAAKEWVNFGGDKTWPSPEADWGAFTGRKGWRPPLAFDGLPAAVQIKGSTLILSTPNDPFYGVRAHRHIQLHGSKPAMTITTTYERLEGLPAKIGVWVITQLKEPVGVFAPAPTKSGFPGGYKLLSQVAPPGLKIEKGLLSLVRNPKTAHKIGLNGESLLWVGESHTLRIESPRVRNAEFPDQGSSTEIYTNPDPLQYIELETLGPLRVVKPGDKIRQSNTYTLSHRSKPTAEAEARSMYGL